MIDPKKLDELFQQLRHDDARPRSWFEVDPETGRNLTREEADAKHAETLARLRGTNR